MISQKLAIPKSEGDLGVKPGKIFKIAVRLSDIHKAHKKHINVAQLHSLISHKLVILKSEGDSGVKPEQIFKIAVRLLDIRKAHKKHINILLIVLINVNLMGALLASCEASMKIN